MNTAFHDSDRASKRAEIATAPTTTMFLSLILIAILFADDLVVSPAFAQQNTEPQSTEQTRQPAKEPPSTTSNTSQKIALTAAEQELVQIVKELESAMNGFYESLSKMSDYEESLQFCRENDPRAEFLPRLLELEKKHRGKNVGFAALLQIENWGGAGGLLELANNRLRPEGIRRMKHYAEHPLFPYLVRGFPFGTLNGNLTTEIRGLIAALPPKSSSQYWAQHYLAEHLVAYRDAREGELSIPVEERDRIYATLPSTEQLHADAEEGEAILQSLSELPPTAHIKPNVIAKNGEKSLLEVSAQKGDSLVSVANLSKGALFRIRYSEEGSPMPSLEVQLLDGTKWSLEHQKGKVVVVMFSFKGCGPCEQMYPILRTLQEDHGDRIEILTIMNDQDIQTTKESVSQGKLPWRVVWDGYRGPVTVAWGVQSFPTLFVYNKQGKKTESIKIVDFPNRLEKLLVE